MNKNKKESFFIKYNLKWVFLISIWTMIMAIIFSVITEGLLVNLDVLMAFIILIIIILNGIIFDIIGIAVTAADEKPFHAMAANRLEEAKYAIRLVRNAGQVSNFCNDVIGDISGIISGGVGTTLIHKLITIYDLKHGSILTILITSLIAAFTVGGKALGKSIAMLNYEKIIYRIAKLLNFLEKNLGVELFPVKKKNKNTRNKK